VVETVTGRKEERGVGMSQKGGYGHDQRDNSGPLTGSSECNSKRGEYLERGERINNLKFAPWGR